MTIPPYEATIAPADRKHPGVGHGSPKKEEW